jgi:hypothetical protein
VNALSLDDEEFSLTPELRWEVEDHSHPNWHAQSIWPFP